MEEDRTFRAWQGRLRFAIELWQESHQDEEAFSGQATDPSYIAEPLYQSAVRFGLIE